MVGNTDLRIIYRLQELWGGTVKKSMKPRNPEKHRQVWHWTLCGQETCEFLRNIQSHLVSKREQADLALEFGKLLNARRNKNKVGEENLRQREDIATQLKLAKHCAA
jgi:hypothetical protein